MQLSAAVVVFAASLPHAIVRHPVGSFHTEHQVLDEGHLHTENTHQTQTGMEQWEWMQYKQLQRASYTYRLRYALKDPLSQAVYNLFCSYTCTHLHTYICIYTELGDL